MTVECFIESKKGRRSTGFDNVELFIKSDVSTLSGGPVRMKARLK